MSDEPTNALRAELRAARVVGVLRARSVEDALERSARAVAAGLRCVEVTFTTPGAAAAIRKLAARHPSVLVGAGTVLSERQASAAAAAGARFLVSPHLDARLLERAADLGVPFVPGALTPSEVQRARDLGAPIVKIFPAARVGGPRYLRDLLGPFSDLEIMATGGVTLDDASDYLAAGALAVGLGSVFDAAEDELRAALERIDRGSG